MSERCEHGMSRLAGDHCVPCAARDEARRDLIETLAAKEAEIARLREALTKLKQWDMNYVGADGKRTGGDTADGPWARELIRAALGETA